MDAPIFIVGVPRSGTTLLAAILGAHDRMSCGPETHFFSRLLNIDADVLCNPETWPKPAVEFLSSITFTSYSGEIRKPLLEKYNLKADQIAVYLEKKEASIYNVLSSVTEQYMQAMGKCRWAEKTPDHIKYLEMIRRYFPESPIVRTIRDPRDIVLSLLKVPWGIRSYFEGLLYWKRMDELSTNFFAKDPLCYTLRYEDLIMAPKRELEALCAFLGEEFQEQMLDTSITGKQINSQNVPWKDKASQPIDPSRLALWRSQLSPAENQIAEALLGDRLEIYKYPRVENLDQFGEIYPPSELSEKYAREIEHIVSSGVRFWKSNDREQTAVQIFLGDPGETNWLGNSKIKRLINMVSLLLTIFRSLIASRTLYWIPNGSKAKWTGFSASVLKKILLPYRISMSNELGGRVPAE